MKIYFLMLYLALMGAQLADAFPRVTGVAPDCSYYEDGETLPDVNSCSQYYLCVGGISLPKRCARGLYYDAITGVCNRAFMVDCSVNLLGHRVKELEDLFPHIEEVDFEMDENYEEESFPVIDESPATTQIAIITCTPTTTTTCETTTTTPCTTTTTTTTCTTTTCTTPTITCTTTTTTCTTTTTTCTTTTTTCTTTTPTCTTTITTPCTATITITHAPCTTKPVVPCITTPVPCTTTSVPPCTKTTPCITTPTPCVTTTKPSTTTTGVLPYFTSSQDCLSLPDKQIILDRFNCRRYYICSNGRTQRYRCRPGYWFDRETLNCRPRSLVTNCSAYWG